MHASMSIAVGRKHALRVIHNELQSVAAHIANMFVHVPSQLDEKWQGDIAALIPKVILYANNVDQKPGKLSHKDMVAEWHGCWLDAIADMRKVWRQDDVKMKKAHKEREAADLAQDELLPLSQHLSTVLANLVLDADRDRDTPDKVAEFITTVVLNTRAHTLNLPLPRTLPVQPCGATGPELG